MASSCAVFIAVSLDGFIARKDGSLDWLDQANAMVPKGEDCGYSAFMASIDALVMGRKSFEKVLSFGGAWPYAGKQVVVLSNRQLAIPKTLGPLVAQDSGSPKAIVTKLAAKNLRRLYIDGGMTIQKFLADDLIDSLTLTVIPVLLGEGITLFGALAKDLRLKLVKTLSYGFGFVQLTYQVDGTSPPC